MTVRRTNNPRFSTAFRKAPLSFRFHVSFEIKDSGCWEWTGTVHSGHGYGIIADKGKDILAHRYSYTWYVGHTYDLCVLHKCDNRLCVNPSHLFLGTRKDNNIDRNEKGRHAYGERHGKFQSGKYVNQKRWRTRPDGSRYFFSGNERG